MRTPLPAKQKSVVRPPPWCKDEMTPGRKTFASRKVVKVEVNDDGRGRENQGGKGGREWEATGQSKLPNLVASVAGLFFLRHILNGSKRMDIFQPQFGGDWTERKLACLSHYLVAYTTALKKQPFSKEYVDAFAGSGYVQIEQSDSPQLSIESFVDEQSSGFLKGSAWHALNCKPAFDHYFFIEQCPAKCRDLEKLLEGFPEKSGRVTIQSENANSFLSRYCSELTHDHGRRAVVFLDPFGMEVEWATIQAIARTKKIDLWLLFPLGVAVMRLLRKDGRIDEPNRHCLNSIFGTDDWFERFYSKVREEDLWGNTTEVLQKDATIVDVLGFFHERLRGEFAGVAENPLILRNSRNNPLYVLFFAVGNSAGKDIALRIAKHILEM